MLIGTYITCIGFACVFLVATAAIVKVAYVATQPGQIFGGWQNVLNRLNEANSRFANAIYKPLGGCEFCFAHMFGAISYLLFILFILNVIGDWPLAVTWPGGSWGMVLANVGTNIVGYLMYVCTSTVLSTFVLTRL
jgi:hypothetical protein